MTYEELITTVSRKLDWPESQTERMLGNPDCTVERDTAGESARLH